MKRRLLAAAYILLLCCLSPTMAFAAWHFDWTSTDNEFWELTFTSDVGGNSIFGYFLDFEYDDVELDWTAGMYTNTPPAGLIADDLGVPFESTQGLINNFNALTLGAPAHVDGTITLGTFTFSTLQSIDDGVADVSFALTESLGVAIDDNFFGADDLVVSADEEGHSRLQPPPAVPVPAMSTWGLVLTAVALIVIGGRIHLRRGAAPSCPRNPVVIS